MPTVALAKVGTRDPDAPGNFILVVEQLAGRTNGALDLPQRAAAIVPERIQRTDLCQRGNLVAAQTAFFDQILD
jgi:hypothetical protein